MSEHYANYLRYASKLRRENSRIATPSQQHTIPGYLPYAQYPPTPAGEGDTD